MPIEQLHKSKLKKNFAVLALIIGFCGLVFAVSIIKMSMNTLTPEQREQLKIEKEAAEAQVHPPTETKDQ